MDRGLPGSSLDLVSSLLRAMNKAGLVAHWRRRCVMVSISSQGDAFKLKPGVEVPVFTDAQKTSEIGSI